jgi:hypothetical protein
MTNDLITQLKALHLYGMAVALEKLLAERPRTTADPLANGEFSQEAYNLTRLSGTGKTHLAIALGIAAIHQGRRCASTMS